jgi:hypothetical protein
MKKIEFVCVHSDGVKYWPNPVPANRILPDDYKKMSRFNDKNVLSPTVKMCVPFLDALSSGYIIPLDQDYLIDAVETDFTVIPASNIREDISYHSQKQLPPSLHKGAEKVGKFICRWIIKTPPGYSCLFLKPLNRAEERFEIISGVVDTDDYNEPINFPFHWKKWNKQTLLEKGCPMVQVIPFKREDWKSFVGFYHLENHHVTYMKIRSYIINKYRKLFWKRKRYK